MATSKIPSCTALVLLAGLQVAALGISSCHATPEEPERVRTILEFAVEPAPGEDAPIQNYPLEDSAVLLGPLRSYRIAGATVASDQDGHPALGFQVASEQRADFRSWTSHHVGRRLGIFLEGRLVSAPVIETALPGTGILAFGRHRKTEEEVRALADRILAENPVPAAPAVAAVPKPAPAILEFAVEPYPGENVPVTRYEHNGAVLELGPKRQFRIARTGVDVDELGYPALRFEVVSEQREEFRSWTNSHVGNQIAMFVDGRLVTAPVLQSALPGGGILNFGAEHRTGEQVRELADRIMASSNRAEP